MFSSKTLDMHNCSSTSIHVSILLPFFFFLERSILLLTSKQNSIPNCVFQDNITILSSDIWKSTLRHNIYSWSTHFLLIAFTRKQKY